MLALCGVTHRQAYGDLFVVVVGGALLALGLVVALGTAFGSF